jgi:hypothetical protein
MNKRIAALVLSGMAALALLTGCQRLGFGKFSLPWTDAAAVSGTVDRNSDSNAGVDEVRSLITREVFLQAVKELTPTYLERSEQSGENLNWDMGVFDENLFYADTRVAGSVYTAVYSVFGGTKGVLVIFRSRGNDTMPVYMDVQGKYIKSAEFCGTFEGNILLKITAIEAGDTGSSQKTQLLGIEDTGIKGAIFIKDLWSYSSVINNTKLLNKNSGLYEYVNGYFSWMLFPYYRQNEDGKQSSPVISTSVILEKIKAEGKEKKEILTTDKTAEVKLFVWDKNKQKFIEEE